MCLCDTFECELLTFLGCSPFLSLFALTKLILYRSSSFLRQIFSFTLRSSTDDPVV